jgi:hypothetical protein
MSRNCGRRWTSRHASQRDVARAKQQLFKNGLASYLSPDIYQ